MSTRLVTDDTPSAQAQLLHAMLSELNISEIERMFEKLIACETHVERHRFNNQVSDMQDQWRDIFELSSNIYGSYSLEKIPNFLEDPTCSLDLLGGNLAAIRMLIKSERALTINVLKENIQSARLLLQRLSVYQQFTVDQWPVVAGVLITQNLDQPLSDTSKAIHAVLDVT